MPFSWSLLGLRESAPLQLMPSGAKKVAWKNRKMYETECMVMVWYGMKCLCVLSTILFSERKPCMETLYRVFEPSFLFNLCHRNFFCNLKRINIAAVDY